MPASTNGFDFNAAIDAAGEHVVLTAHKDDHEGRRTEVFRLTAAEAHALATLLTANVRNAKDRRKAVRRAEVAARVEPHPTEDR